jgi:N-acetylneuraminate synthase
MSKVVHFQDRPVGEGHPVYIMAEIGINHNGDLGEALKLVDLAVMAGCDGVKFQKRTPELCVPEDQKARMRETPWGYISYLEYRYKIEFGQDEYEQIDAHCKKKGIQWTASCWDIPSLEFMSQFEVPVLKVASASLTDVELLEKYKATGKPIILSSGMSSMEQIREGVELVGQDDLVLCHSTSTYPCKIEELNLRMIQTLRETFECPIGYSGHEEGLPTTEAAVVLGAKFIERHITLDRAAWGSDQAASVAPIGLMRLVNHIRTLERALGDGVKKVYDSELPLIEKLRLKK